MWDYFLSWGQLPFRCLTPFCLLHQDEAQDNGGILYASLTLSSSSSPVAHPPLSKMSPQEETLYSILKA